MSVYALAEFPVEGYEYFRQSFLDNADSVGACESARVFSSDPEDGGGDILVVMRWPDHDTLARFRAELERDLASGGDMAPGEVSERDDEPGVPAGLVETEDLLATRRGVSRSGG